MKKLISPHKTNRSGYSINDNVQDGRCPLASEIVIQAIMDYKALVAGAKGIPQSVNFYELKKFFLSEWCDWLLEASGSDISGKDILKLLDNWAIGEEDAND